MAAEGDLSASLTFRRGAARVSLERVAMLEAIGELGSISAAAKRHGLSYKGAWDVVQALNNLFEGPLVDAAPGGKSGGTAIVTPRGQAVITAFHRVRTEIEATLAKLESNLGSEPASDLFWSLGMRTSARNALRGKIGHITPGAVSGEVTLDVADGVTITAMLTRRSIQDLDLVVGKSARNQIPGAVLSREDGAVNSEIAVDIGGGKTLVATITLESAEALELAPGVKVTALVKAPHVILAVE